MCVGLKAHTFTAELLNACRREKYGQRKKKGSFKKRILFEEKEEKPLLLLSFSKGDKKASKYK